jgi:hypothetical protein
MDWEWPLCGHKKCEVVLDSTVAFSCAVAMAVAVSAPAISSWGLCVSSCGISSAVVRGE